MEGLKESSVIAITTLSILWLTIAAIVTYYGWKGARHLTRKSSGKTRLWAGISAALLCFYAGIGFYIHKELMLYRQEKAQVAHFCATLPREASLIPIEEYKTISESTLPRYNHIRYDILETNKDSLEKLIKYRDSEYELGFSYFHSDIALFGHVHDSGRFSYEKYLFVSVKEKLALHETSQVKATYHENSPLLGLHLLYKTIHPCPRGFVPNAFTHYADEQYREYMKNNPNSKP